MISLEETHNSIDLLKHELTHLKYRIIGILKGKKTNNEVLGKPGREKVVRVHPYDEKKVIAELHPENAVDHRRALGQYELSALIHLLFPDNIPAIYYVRKKGQFCLERIEADSNQPEITIKDETTFSLLMQKIGISIDIARSNLVVRNGKLIYLDNSFIPWSEDGYPKYNKNLLTMAILDHLDSSQQAKALRHLSRLEELRHQTENSYREKFKN